MNKETQFFLNEVKDKKIISEEAWDALCNFMNGKPLREKK
jgi:hypothetical protein